MYVINLALDPKALDPESVVSFRNRAYGTLVDHYSTIIPSPETVTVHVSDTVTAYGVGGRSKFIQLIKIYRKALECIRQKKCDVISADMYFLGLIAFLLAKRHHLGFEVQVLGIEKLTWFRKRIATFVLNRASVIRALSNRLKNRLVHEFGIKEEKIHVVPIYVDVHKLGLDVRTLSKEDSIEFEKRSAKFRTSYGSCINFLTVSRLVPIKRIGKQLRALKALIPTYPHIMLHIVGAGPLDTEIKKEVATLGIGDHVIFYGYQTGSVLGQLYIECDAFLLTSDYEGWGMVVIEAATAGLPIIMTDVGCAGEFIINERSGLIVPVHDEESLKNAMGRFIQEPRLREALSVGAMQAVTLLPSFESILEEYKKNWEIALTHSL